MPCNHIFHTSCLRSWFQRHQTCPTCRLDILRPTPLTPTATPTVPMHRAAQSPTTVPANTHSTDDLNRQGSFIGNRPSGSQTGSRSNNQIPQNFKFRTFTFQPQAPNNENNTNNNDPNSNNGQPLHNINESLIALINATRLGNVNGFGLPPSTSK